MTDQTYKGNGNHEWEFVVENEEGFTERLRVPGGWIYRVRADLHAGESLVNTVFVPMPEVVNHKI